MPRPTESAKTIFGQALAIESAEQRAQFLDQMCEDNPELRAEVEDLLSAADRAGNFLGEPTGPAAQTFNLGVEEKPGAQIGPYKLLQEIGEGGMGVVYMAEQQEPVNRRVALKIIKPGMDSRQVIARFETERQALAMMDHPNIAKVLDCGTTDAGRPYFVMELVKGMPITKYCDENHLTPKERLELFVPVCQAIQHAHQKGIIHRDIKPSNILVAEYDHKAVPKIIDFGVAKALNQSLTNKTMYTQLGQVVGTLEYMSPEQAQVNQVDVDTRSDIYSLGVLMYELLTGATPFDRARLRPAAFDEMLRIIREEEPPCPSARLSTIDELPSVAANRHVEPHKLMTLIRGELDWIVMKALEKERARRYETASEFAADIQHYLNDETVVACPPSAGYRLKKFVCRNKAPIGLASVITAALVLGIIGTTWQAIRANAERDRAQTESIRARRAENAAVHHRQLAEVARDAESKLRTEREAQLARSYVERGLRLSGENDLRSLLWFVEALRLEQADPRRAVPHRLRLAAALRRCPKLVQVCYHNSPMWSVHFSPDGKFLVTTDHHENEERAAQVWEVASGRLIALLKHDGGVGHAAFSPDSRKVATAGVGELADARVWDVVTGQQALPPLKHESGVKQVLFSADGSRVATVGHDDVRVWHAGTGDSIGNPIRPGQPMLRTWFRNEGQQIVTSSGERPTFSVNVWDVATGTRVGPTPTLDLRYHFPTDLSPDGLRLTSITTGRRPKTIRIWEVDSAQLLNQLQPMNLPTDARFSSDGSRVLVPCYGPVSIWDAATGRAIWSLRHGVGSTAASLGPDGRRIATVGNWDATCRIWDLGPVDDSVPLPHDAGLHHAAFSADGRRVVTSGTDGTARIWETASGNSVGLPLRHEGEVFHSEFSADGRRIVTAAETGEARVWDATTGIPVTPVLQHTGPVYDATFSPDGRMVATAGGLFRTGGGEARVWDAATGEPITPLMKHVFRVQSISFSPDGRMVLTSSPDKTARLWDAATGDPVSPSLEHETKVSHAVFSPDGRLVATSCWGQFGAVHGTAHVWDVSTATQIAGPLRHPEGVSHVAFSPDGRRIVTAGFDMTARIWDVETGREMLPALRHGGPVYHVEFSADGLLVVTAASGHSSRVWDAATAQPLTPPFTHEGAASSPPHASFSPHGRQVVTVVRMAKGPTAKLWSLADTEQPLEVLTRISQLLSGHQIDPFGAVTPIDADRFRALYEQLRDQHPELFLASQAFNVSATKASTAPSTEREKSSSDN